ncbi:MAG: beta-ketoacyl synthase N-terminal-like domain-containing protein [Terriglobales bacterium]
MSATGQSGRPVVLTGSGVLLPWGVGVAALAAPAAAARMAQFNPRDYIRNARALRAMHRGFQLTAAAASLALGAAGIGNDAEGLAAAGVAPERAGLVMAAGDVQPITPDLLAVLAAAGGGDDWGEAALHGLHPFRRLHLLTNMAAAHVSILFNFQGPSLTLTSGAEAAAQALAEAAGLLAEGRADLVLCAASDCPEQTLFGGEGEAAAAVVLEAADSAARRGVREAAAWEPGGGAEGWEERFPLCGPLLAALAARAAAPAEAR